jgi:hypothetical protein
LPIIIKCNRSLGKQAIAPHPELWQGRERQNRSPGKSLVRNGRFWNVTSGWAKKRSGAGTKFSMKAIVAEFQICVNRYCIYGSLVPLHSPTGAKKTAKFIERLDLTPALSSRRG